MWRLFRGAELVGEVVIDDADFPWLFGQFRPLPGFADVRPWFDQEYALLGSGDEAWDRIYDRITGELRLEAPDGPVAEFLLHIQGDKAWFRWSDEPLPEPPA